MIEFEKALDIILKNSKKLPKEKVAVDSASGRTLAEDITTHIEMPPFDKSAMDGYAVRYADIRNIPARLRCIGTIEAGKKFNKRIKAGECAKIMTGAGLPEGADTVVMVEDTEISGAHTLIMRPVEKKKNVCFRGEDIKKGQKVLKEGRRISLSDIALMATVGRRAVEVTGRPRVAVLNTGGEIVQPGRSLGQRQIYNCNGPQLIALLRSDMIEPDYLGIAKDRQATLTTMLKKALGYDVILISGGVSVGDYDLVPHILKKLGVKKLFHNVKTKPGKPLYFGKNKNTIVFGIPGNPVSNFVVYMLYIRPALYKMMGISPHKPAFIEGVAARTFYQKPGRKHFIPSKITNKANRFYLAPVMSHGSADIVALSGADCFMVVEANKRIVKAKSKVAFMTWKDFKNSP